MDKLAERRKPRKPRSSKNRKPYGTSKALEQILNGEKTQNDIIAEKELKENGNV